MAIQFNVNATNKNHYIGDMQNTLGNVEKKSQQEDGFWNMLKGSINKANDMQIHASDLTRKMITNPEQVEIHDVMISMEQAKMALNLTRVIRDTAIKSYKDITNLR